MENERAAGSSGELVAGSRERVAQPVDSCLSARFRELIDGSFRELLVSLGLGDSDQPGFAQLVDGPVQVCSLVDLDDLVLAPDFEQALDRVGVQRSDFHLLRTASARGEGRPGRMLRR
jgi:hypothetical protein